MRNQLGRLKRLEKEVRELRNAVCSLMDYFGIEAEEEWEPFTIKFKRPVFNHPDTDEWECG